MITNETSGRYSLIAASKRPTIQPEKTSRLAVLAFMANVLFWIAMIAYVLYTYKEPIIRFIGTWY